MLEVLKLYFDIRNNFQKDLLAKIPTLIKDGLSAAIYTQTTDVEGEVNGLMTYDRAIIKMDVDEVHKANSALYKN